MAESADLPEPPTGNQVDPTDSFELIQACLHKRPFAWQQFVDRYLGTVIQVIDHLAESTSLKFSKSQREAVVKQVFQSLRDNDYKLLRHYRDVTNFETYLTLCTRRIIMSTVADPSASASDS